MSRTYSFCLSLWLAALVMLWCAFQAVPAEPAQHPQIKNITLKTGPAINLETFIKKLTPRAQAVPVISAQIMRSAADYRLPAPVIAAVIWTESTFDVAATNGRDHGLMGVREQVWRGELDGHDLFDAGDNIRAGCYILNKYVQQYGSVKAALKHYNGGSDKYALRVLDRAQTIREAVYE